MSAKFLHNQSFLCFGFLRERSARHFYMTIIREKSFYRDVMRIALPIALQNFISFAVSMADTVMLGRAADGELLLSAAAQANQPFFVLSMFCFGLASGGNVLAAQYWGKRDVRSIQDIFSIVLKVGGILGLAMGLFVLLAPETVMGIYTNRADVIEKGSEYLRIIGYAYFTFGLSSTALCLLRSVEIVKISVFVNILSFGLNVFLNWVLIFGNLGAPAMGIKGAAIATLAARLLEFVITAVFVLKVDTRLMFRLKKLFSFNKTLGRDLLRYGSPVLVCEASWSIATTIQSIILGHIAYSAGDPLAANSITGMLQQLSLIVIFGIANAAAVIIGRTIGEGDLARARHQADTFRLMGYILGVVAALLLLSLRKVAVGFFDDFTPETKQLAEEMIVALSFIILFVGTSGMSLVGTLRGGGDTKFCLLVETGVLWLITTPLAFISSFVLQLPVPIVLACMKSDEVVKSVLTVFRIRGGKWLKSVTRDNDELDEAKTIN